MLIQKEVKRLIEWMIIRTVFESLVNTEGSKTFLWIFYSCIWFESLVNTEVINKTEINQRES